MVKRPWSYIVHFVLHKKGSITMAVQTKSETTTGMKSTLGLTGVTINAMALIAPGAFLWTTYQLQSSPSTAMNMWAAVFVATAIALLTATAYAALAKLY